MTLPARVAASAPLTMMAAILAGAGARPRLNGNRARSERAIRAAIRLLRRHGYRVEPPEGRQ